MRDSSGVDRRSIFGIKFSSRRFDSIVDTIVEQPADIAGGPRLLVTANLDHIVLLTRSNDFREAYRRSWMAVIDGTPVWLYARMRGLAVPGRVTGADLFPAILSRLHPQRHRIALVCASEASADALRIRLNALGFDEALVFTAPPRFEGDARFTADLLERLRRHKTTHLFFGLGAPKSEIWMDRHRAELPPCYGFAFGAGLDFFAGTKRRAPQIFRKLGAEFLWRVMTEPRRLFKRYFVSSWAFLGAVAADLSGKSLV